MVIVHFCPHDGGVMYEWHWPHFLNELEQAGIKIIDCNPNSILKRKGLPHENAEIVKDIALKAKREYGKCVFFAAQGRDDNLDPNVLSLLRKHDIPSINLCVDGWFEVMHVRKIGKYFDINWVTHYNALNIKKFGCNVVYMPMGVNPYFFKPVCKYSERKPKIVFIGSNYGGRSNYIKALINGNIKIEVFGKGWDGNASGLKSMINNNIDLKIISIFLKYKEGRKIILSGVLNRIINILSVSQREVVKTGITIGPELSLKGMVETYSKYILSLGVAELGNTHILKHPLYQYRLRDFECPAIGCCHLVKKVKELEECFEEEKEILFYENIKECVDKANYYLSIKNVNKAIKIGMAARKRCISSHTWMHRFNILFSLLNI